MQYRLRTLLILMAAAPVWVYLTTIVSTANRDQRLDKAAMVLAPILLAGIAAAVYRLTRRLPGGFAIAVLLSPMIPLIWILAVRTFNRYFP
jgi:hypothetical protein